MNTQNQIVTDFPSILVSAENERRISQCASAQPRELVKDSSTDKPLRVIARQCTTLTQAERYQNRLYSQYNRVMLTGFPRFSEHGQYVWQVRDRIADKASQASTTQISQENK
jgi:hypothetical protein